MGLPTRSPLAILTRPQGRNAALAMRLRQAGLRVLEAPALAIETLDTPRPQVAAGDLCVFVSGQAVAAHFSQADAGWPDDAWACAVGTATARALQAHVPADRILAPDEGSAPDSEALLRIIDARRLQSGRAHVLRAQQGRDWLAQQLQVRGWSVTAHALYRRTAQLWPAAVCRTLAGASDVVLLVTSLEALDAIAASLQQQALPWPPRLQAVTLHARITRRLQYLYAARPGGVLGVTLSAPDETALFQAILTASRPLS